MDKEDDGNGIIEGLFKSKELYRILFEDAGEAIIFASDTKIIDCNIAALTLFGFQTKSDILGKNLAHLCPGIQDDDLSSAEKLKSLIAENDGKNPKKFQWKYKKAGGALFLSESTLQTFNE